MSKTIVHYDVSKSHAISEGHGAYIFPVDHPSNLVSNSAYCFTSTVVKYDPISGEFETENTLYKPANPR